MASKYRHRKPDREEFLALMQRAGMNINDFVAITGRHAEDVLAFLNDAEPTKQPGASRTAYVPRIGDILLLELAARDNALVDTMIGIVNAYALEEPQRRKEDARYWG